MSIFVDLTTIYSSFQDFLKENRDFTCVKLKKIAGVPFLYIVTEVDRNRLEKRIKEAASRSMKGKRLSSQTLFVRYELPLYVYRHRFFVPQRKMFCCGNICPDCIRFTKDFDIK